ncbi:MAG: SDR family oxidoreductase [Actinobacteria bacterium]|nr:SDR family oxidoreductase [Actinomycetota bacterium]
MTPAPFDLAGRVALVTGAGSPTGIGFATARLLGELGAHVAVTSTTERVFDRVAELETTGVRGFGVVGDLTDEHDVSDVVSAVATALGGIDILVNNAGMLSIAGAAETGRITDMSLATWRAGIERNLDTAFLVSRAVLPGMQDRGWGRIVNVTSVTGPVMAMRDEVAYAAAKAAMVGLARSIAVDFGPVGVTSNAVAPGWISTGSQTAHEYEQGLRTPVGRSATPTEVASAIAWLCTPGAAYTTGQCLVVDGGNSVAEERT